MNPSALIDDYLSSVPLLRSATAGMTADQLRARPIAGKWSTLEVVCHLTDSEQAWCHRMKRVIVEDKPLLIGYDETRFTAGLPYHELEIAVELDLIEAMRKQMAKILRTLPESAWSRTAVHNERGLMTLSDMLDAENYHIPHHVKQIVLKRQALGLAAV